MRNEMMHLLPHHRRHIPNKLAMFAVFLLLISSVTGFEGDQKSYSSSQETLDSVKTESVTNSDATEQKRRGLKLGLLLFRRG